MPSYKSPGTYIEEIPKFPPTITYQGNAVPVVLGYTETAIDLAAGDLILKPKRITTLREYERYFGSPQSESQLYLTVNYTLNAAGQVLTTTAKAETLPNHRSLHILYYAMQMYFGNGGGACYILSIGAYKPLASALSLSEFQNGLVEAAKVDEATLIIMSEAQSLPNIDYRSLVDTALAQCAKDRNRFIVLDVPASIPGKPMEIARTFRNECVGKDNLRYGAAYLPAVVTSLSLKIDSSKQMVSLVSNGVTVTQTLSELAIKHPGSYQAIRVELQKLYCSLPASAAVAGIYQSIENTQGYWKSPANVSLRYVVKPVMAFTTLEQDEMNVDPVGGKSLNTIRQFVGKGTLVWGARTLAGNDNEFRYVHVSRMVSGIEASIQYAVEQLVFEPNNKNTWNKTVDMVNAFLYGIWAKGGLQGEKPENAYYVRMGLGITMTQLDIANGIGYIEAGVACIRPSEFITFKVRIRFAQT